MSLETDAVNVDYTHSRTQYSKSLHQQQQRTAVHITIGRAAFLPAFRWWREIQNV